MERGGGVGTPIEADPLILSAGRSHCAITERILALADQSGHKAAVIDAVDGTVTAWPRFGWTIRAAAHGLSRRGLAAGDTVGVFVQDAASFAVAVNAIRAAGATALPLRPDASVADVAAQLNADGARLLITSAPLAGLAAEAADRSRVRQVFAFGEAAGTTPFRSLLDVAKHGADTHGTDTGGADTGGAGPGGAGPGGAEPGGAEPGAPEGAAGQLTSLHGRAGLSHLDVVVAGPPCGDGPAYTSLLDLTLLTGATIVAAPVPLVTAAMRVYRGTAAIVPGGTTVPGLAPDRVFTVALSRSGGGRLLLCSLNGNRSRRGPRCPDKRDDHQQAAHVEDRGEAERGRYPVREDMLRDSQRAKPGERMTGRVPARGAVHRNQNAEADGAADQLQHVHQARGGPGVRSRDACQRCGRQRHEHQPHPEADQQHRAEDA
ncbi:MAG: AMP-binding protein [Trebonia sp.]